MIGNNSIYILFMFALILIGCSNTEYVKNELEIELDSIQENISKKELGDRKFVNFKIDWTSPDQWESNCSHYYIVPVVDTFEHEYYLDFCYKKYRWWSKNLKKD